MKPLGENEYLVHVVAFPSREDELFVADLPPQSLLALFYSTEWKNHPSCAGVDDFAGERVMLLKQFGREIKSDEAIAEMDRQGYRPATHLEAYAFASTYPELVHCQEWVIALGSSMPCEAGWAVSALASDFDRRILRSYPFFIGIRWRPDDRFLFVRKTEV
jgi:hypothetical protein